MGDDRQIEQIAELLAKSDLFHDLARADLTALASFARQRAFAAGVRIFSMGDPGESLMSILEGAVRIGRPTADGCEMLIADLGVGEVFGEIALLDGDGRS